MAASTARALLSSSVTSLSLGASHRKLQPPAPPFSHHLLIVRPLLPAVSTARRRDVASCVISGVDGGGVSDDFVLSTRKSGFSREFSVIANMLKRIEPLDVSVISQGVSDAAKDSMKQTISTMLGLLPSDQFSVTVRVSRHPLDRLIVSSIITGYTLWNAEYRVLLMRNFDLSFDDSQRQQLENDLGSKANGGDDEGTVVEERQGGYLDDSKGISLESFESLSPQVSSYIQHLQSELSSVKQELDTCKQKNIQMEQVKRSNNNLLEYLRSLESDMVIELSKPSSSEVNDFIHQLSQSILQRFFKEDIVTNHAKDPPPGIGGIGKFNDGVEECQDALNTSRDYLAKLLFWCMLLGHHLRALENRLHLNCAVGLL